MKTANTQIKRILSLVVLVTVLVLNAGVVKANNEKTVKTLPVEVKYVGSMNEQPVLEVSLDNESAEDVNITLRDLDGNVLYSANFTDKKIAKKFQFDNHGTEEIKIKVTVTAGKKTQTDTFQINRNSQVIEEVVIAKL